MQTISDVIKKLEAAREKYGDVPVYVEPTNNDRAWWVDPIVVDIHPIATLNKKRGKEMQYNNLMTSTDDANGVILTIEEPY